MTNTHAVDECFLGTEKKYRLEIEAEGFEMARHDFEVILKRGGRTLSFPKSALGRDGDGGWLLTFDTRALGPGLVTATVTAHVPDQAFPDGIRDEVKSFPLLIIKVA